MRKRIEQILTRLMPLVYYTRRTGWYLRRPITLGVRTIVLDGDQILLVRSHSSHHWQMPGGAVSRNETLAEAARREVREETGCTIEIERLLGMYFNQGEFKSDHIAIFVGRARSPIRHKLNIEIAEVRYFPLAGLPPLVDSAVLRRLKEYEAAMWGMQGPW